MQEEKPPILVVLSALVFSFFVCFVFFLAWKSQARNYAISEAQFDLLLEECTAYCDSKTADVPIKCIGGEKGFYPQYYQILTALRD